MGAETLHSTTSRGYGIHDWIDHHGNIGTEIVSQHQINTRTVRVDSLFDLNHEKTRVGLARYFGSASTSERNIFVVVDSQLPERTRIEIETYFLWCKMEKLLQNYTIIGINVQETEKTLDQVLTVVAAAKTAELKRRDLFIAIGSSTVSDIVGFAAATYRRSAPWISVPTDLAGIIHGFDHDKRLDIDYRSPDGTAHKSMLTLYHPPIANFYDPSLLKSSRENGIRKGLVELIRISVRSNSDLFSYLECHLEEILSGIHTLYVVNAVELAAKTMTVHRDKAQRDDTDVSLEQEALHAIQVTKGIAYNQAETMAIAIALSSALLFLLGHLDSANLDRILDILEKAGLPIYDGALEAAELSRHMTSRIPSRVAVVMAFGKEFRVDVTYLSLKNLGAALSLLRKHCHETSRRLSASTLKPPTTDINKVYNGFHEGDHERTVIQDMQYHVATVPQLFNASNTTLVEDYCVGQAVEHKKKVLVIVDDHLGSKVTGIEGYFKAHRSAIDDVRILPMHVSSAGKDFSSVTTVIDAAVELGMSKNDILLVVGGGTLMDVVGFAAAIFKGGISYVRIATTLVGMIDAGVGAKVGVNFENHKSLVGRYYPPIACLNDPETFLMGLPRREFACGLAEAAKMAMLKSSRLFEVIERYHLTGGYNRHTNELIHISIRTMLEELQPNLHEHDLRRLVDFGHEFGHMVESNAKHEIPHGECVAIGMALSSSLAHMKGIFSKSDLERLLNCLLNLGLPIFATDYDCCDAGNLWNKIRTEGIEHKDGMLWLAIPETIGQGNFLDNISDIDASMVREALLNLEHYQIRHKKVDVSRTDMALEPSPSMPKIPSANGIKGHHVVSGSKPLTDDKGSRTITAAIIGASGDIGMQLTKYLAQNGVQVICSVRETSLHSFKQETEHISSMLRILTGDVTDSSNLQIMIQEANVLYNMAGVVTLNSKPEELANVVAINGFAQGMISYLIYQMGRHYDVKVVYPSTQRVHLTSANLSVETWTKEAVHAYHAYQDNLASAQDAYSALKQFTQQFITRNPLPAEFNVYELSKQLGESFVSSLPYHVSVRISGVYGPSFTRGFIHRAVNPKLDGNIETSEVRDFIYIDDLNELLLKAAHAQPIHTDIFDAASGEAMDLQKVWQIVRELKGDHAAITFRDSAPQTTLKLDPSFARHLLQRDFTPLRLGLQNIVGRSARSWEKPYIIVVDVGATYLRVGVVGPCGLLEEPSRIPSPSKQAYSDEPLAMLQERLLATLRYEVDLIRARYRDLPLEDVAISFGAVINRGGVVEDASILWNESSRGYHFKNALRDRLPGLRLTILNDISAAAWRYQDEGRFCLITVSSGLSNKVFNPDLSSLDKLDLDTAGVGGEMGHVVVEPRAVDAVVQGAISEAEASPAAFKQSQLSMYADGDPQKINARYLGMAAKDGDNFTLNLLDAADMPHCTCGNLADLCSYSSGRGALRHAQRLATRGNHGLDPSSIDDHWLHQAIETGHPLALKVLHDSTYPLALRILQLAADIGLDKFIVVGGFAMKTGQRAYLQKLQDHLVHFCHQSAFFSTWDEAKIRGLVRFGVNDDNDSLLGAGRFVQHSCSHYRAVEKVVGEQSLKLVTRRIPRCGTQEILAKVLFSGICTTDLQILRGERGHEPTVLGHEGVCHVLEVGKDVTGLEVGENIILNPNNPLDDHDKLGHTREGVFQEFIKFGHEFLKRDQVLKLGRSAVSATDTLVEPLSCVVAAQERIKDRIAGKNVLVVGAGMMGLLFVSMNIMMGARNVFLANRSKERLDFAATRGIISEDKTFVIGQDISSQVKHVTTEEGADIVIVCVSIGHGGQAAQDALAYINPGGCVYLFAGFRPGDVLTADNDANIDAWVVRTGWKTEQIHYLGKPVDVSGHRGCRNEDLATAAKYIRRDSLTFGRLISHIISLDALPETLLSVARDGNIEGVPAKRVVVDMAAQDMVVETAVELPLRQLHNAARKHKDSIPLGNIFREIGFEGSNSLLGWVHPPEWQAIKTAVESALRMNSLSSKRHFVWVGTGAWTFLVDTLRQVLPESQDTTFHTLQSLDPDTLADLLGRIEDLSATVCIGVSQSGTTIEAVLLMNTLRERFDSAGLDYREHFLWLTDMSKSKNDFNSGETSIRSHEAVDWQHVDMMALTIENHADINALFCVPYSTIMFLPLLLLLHRDLEAMRHVYQTYLALRERIVHGILAEAYSVASFGLEHIQVALEESIATAMIPLVTQLIEQALGSKQASYNPRVSVTAGAKINSLEGVALPIPSEAPVAAKIMLTMNALSIFVAMVAYHRRIHFVTHPGVNLYKRRAAELLETSEPEHDISNTSAMNAEINSHLGNNSQTRFVEVLCYGYTPASHRQILEERLRASIAPAHPNISLKVAQGEQWNHSRYQAAVNSDDTLFVVLVTPESCSQVEGISESTIQNNIRTLKAIARATYETLLPKALFFRVGEELTTNMNALNGV